MSRNSQRRRIPVGRPCSFGGCDRVIQGRGLCASHLQQRRAGKRLHPVQIRGDYMLDHATAGDYERIEREMLDGTRCKCGLSLPCNDCLPPTIDAYAEKRRER